MFVLWTEPLGGDYGPLIKQSERAYYRSHIISTVEPRYFEPSGEAKNSSKYREFELANSK